MGDIVSTRSIPVLTTEHVMHEAIASAYGNRNPQSRQWERDEMAGASIARTRSRMTHDARRELFACVRDALTTHAGGPYAEVDGEAAAVVVALLGGDS